MGKIGLTKRKSGKGKAAASVGYEDEAREAIANTTGCEILDLGHSFREQALSSLASSGEADEKLLTQKMQTVVGIMQGLAPKNEVEGLLATQIIAVHVAAMECLR